MALYSTYDDPDAPPLVPPPDPTTPSSPGMPVPTPAPAPTGPTGTTQHNVLGGKATKDSEGWWALFDHARGDTRGTTTDLQNLVSSNPILEASIVGGSRGDVQRPAWAGGDIWDVIYGAGGPEAQQHWQRVQGGGGGLAGPPGVGGTQNVFSDPATAEWERLLRSLVDRLNQPRPLGYTASQQELIATQALDPLERQRQQQKRNAMQRFASMGHSQNSGPMQMALADIDRQFDAMGAQARAGFAMNQIGLEDQRFNQNENRAMQAVSQMFQLPQLADARFAQYANFVNGNPVTQGQGLLNMLMQQNQFNQGQSNNFWAQFIAALGNLFDTNNSNGR